MLKDRTDRIWFSRLLRHPARKCLLVLHNNHQLWPFLPLHTILWISW